MKPQKGQEWEHKRHKTRVTIDNVSKRGCVTFTTKLDLLVYQRQVDVFTRNYRPVPKVSKPEPKHVPQPDRCECGTETDEHADSCPAMFGACGDCEVCGSLSPWNCGHYDEDGNLIDDEKDA